MSSENTNILPANFSTVDLEAKSAGFLMGNYAEIHLNQKLVEIPGGYYRGYNVAIIDPNTGDTVTAKFDVLGRIAFLDEFARFIDGIPDGQIVAIAVKDDATLNMNERFLAACESLGSQKIRQLQFRGAWAFIAVKGQSNTATESLSNTEPVAIKTQIQLAQPQDKYPVSVVSAGLLADNRVDIWVEEKQVFTNEEGQRGFNIVVVDPFTRQVTNKKSFDVLGSTANVVALEQFISDIPIGHLALVAAKDEASSNLTQSTHAAFRTIGAARSAEIRFRDSYVLIGRKGAAPGTVPELFGMNAIRMTARIDLVTMNAFTFSKEATSAITVPGFTLGTGDFTLEGWIKANESGPVLVGESASKGKVILGLTTDGRFRFGIADQSHTLTIESVTTDLLTSKAWHHISASRTNDKLSLFLNGQPISGRVWPETIGTSPQPDHIDVSQIDTFTIGAANVASDWWSGQNERFVGAVDEIRVWQRALTTDDIQHTMFHTLTGSEKDLLGYWRFDNQTVADSSAHRRPTNTNLPVTFEAGVLDKFEADHPYLVVQTKLMEDYHLGNRATVPTSTDTYRVVITAHKGNGQPFSGQEISLQTDAEILYRHGGDSDKTNAVGEVSFALEAKDKLAVPIVRLRAEFMGENEWLIISPDKHAHHTLSQMTGPKLLGDKPDGTPAGPQTRKLLEANYANVADPLAQAVSHLMKTAAGHQLHHNHPLTRSRSTPVSDVSLPTNHHNYQNSYVSHATYNPKSNVIPSHYVNHTLPLERVVTADFMPNPHWSFHHAAQAVTAGFTPMTPQNAHSTVAALNPTTSDPLTQEILNKLSQGQARMTRQQLDSVVRRRSVWSDFATKLDQAASIIVHTVKVEVEDAETGATRVVNAVLAVAHEIKDEVNTAVAYVIHTVEEAVNMVTSLLSKVAVTIEKAINFIKGLFNWQDILNTQSVIEWHMNQFVSTTRAYIPNAREEVNNKLDSLKEQMDTSLQSVSNKLGTKKMGHGQTSARHKQPKDMQATYIHHQLSNNAGSDQAEFNIDIGTLTNSATTRGQSLGTNIAGSAASFNNRLATQQDDLAAVFSSLSSLMSTGLKEILDVIQALVDEAIYLIKAGMSDVFDFLNDLLVKFEEIMTTPIVIPFITPLYETIITEGRDQLTLMSLISLGAAAAVTITYKIARLTDEPMFSTEEKDRFQGKTFTDIYRTLPSQERTISTTELQKASWAVGGIFEFSLLAFIGMTAIEDSVEKLVKQAEAQNLPTLTLKKKLSGLSLVNAIIGTAVQLGQFPLYLFQEVQTDPNNPPDPNKPSEWFDMAIWITQFLPPIVDWIGFAKPDDTALEKSLNVVLGAYGVVHGAMFIALYGVEISELTASANANIELLDLTLKFIGNFSSAVPEWDKLVLRTKEEQAVLFEFDFWTLSIWLALSGGRLALDMSQGMVFHPR